MNRVYDINSEESINRFLDKKSKISNSKRSDPVFSQNQSLIQSENKKMPSYYLDYIDKSPMQSNKYLNRKRRLEVSEAELNKFLLQNRELCEVYLK